MSAKSRTLKHVLPTILGVREAVNCLPETILKEVGVMKEKNKTFSISQVSQMTGVSKNRIREWHDKGLLPLVKYGKSS
jgi:hypothetical protein